MNTITHHRGTEDTEKTAVMLGEERYVHKELTERIIGAAIEVHRALGPGLLESVYEECLADEFQHSGIQFTRQLELPIEYKGR